MEQDYNFSSYNNIKRLSDEELVKVWDEYLADKTNKKLRDTLIVQYIYLTRYVVGRIKVALPPTFSFEDISSFGIEGLIDAVEKYTPKLGAKFETYALIRIRGNIIDKIRSQDFLPRSIRRKIKEIKDKQEELKQTLGRPATNSEIADALGMEKERIDQILSEDTSITSIYDKKMADVIAKSGLPCCLMHNRQEAVYQDFLKDVVQDMKECVQMARNAGVADDKIILDPGVGFGKNYQMNLDIIHHVDILRELGFPILLGTSRKSVIGQTLNLPTDQRVEGTLATTVLGVIKGCAFVRVHDIKENKRVIQMTEAILGR